MSTWVLGDLHGCGETFRRLRARIDFTPGRDRLIVVGDLINRGPTSLDTLRWIVANDAHVRVVLGNHDLHLLWCALGCGMPKPKDTLHEILNATDRDTLIGWLRRQPFAIAEDDFLVVHAGIHPEWTVEYAVAMSARLQARLSADDAGSFLNRMRANIPQSDDERELFHGLDVLTRMRTLRRSNLALDTSYSGTLADTPPTNRAWFEVPSALPRPSTVFFGHWAALGFHRHGVYQCLDSGCVWKRALTAWRLEDGHVEREAAND